MQITDGRSKSKEAQREIRMIAIKLWKQTGNMQEVARTFGVSYSAVRKWVDRYKADGVKVLISDDRGRPEGKELTPEQEKKIISKITNNHPEQLKLVFGLWTRENVGELIFQEYGIRRSPRQIVYSSEADPSFRDTDPLQSFSLMDCLVNERW